jgi:hypothetical protein
MQGYEELLAWLLGLALGLYLLTGLAVAGRRFAKRQQRHYKVEAGDVAQFFVEALLWPAALVISRSG